MNLKPEHIPDEVVEAAMRAEQEFYAEKRYTSFSDIGSTDAHHAMKSALAAALPVLLGEPVMWRARCADGKFMHFDYEPKHMREYRPLYTLPTQDTPNADQ